MIQTETLARYYGSLAAVQDLNLTLEQGELFGFLGPNGAGKTTTMSMIVGLLRPTAGTVRVAGHDVQQEPLAVKRAVGYLAQAPLLYERLTGREFLRFLGGLYGLSDEKIEARTEHLMALTDLSDKADHLIETYSGGMRHKIGLCGAVLHEPPVLVLDEPLTGLDPYSARSVKDLLRDLCRQGSTVFLSTHVLEVAERVCDRVGILDQGCLVAVGTMEALRARPNQRRNHTGGPLPATDRRRGRSRDCQRAGLEGRSMVWRILRPHYWILDRKVRTTNRAVVVALILLLAFGGQWVYNNLIRDNLAFLNSEQAVTVVASSLPFGLFLLLMFAMLGVGDVMHQLCLASDPELLMVAPIPVRTIFLVKLLQCSRATFVPALGFGTFPLALGLAQDAAVSCYLLIVLLIVAAIALTTAVMILVILLARLLPAQKTRSWLPVLVALATLILMLGQHAATQWFLGQAALITFLIGALLNPGKSALVVAGLGGLALVTGLGAYRIFATAFHEGWDRFREVPTRRAPLPLATRRCWGISQLVRSLRQPLHSFLIKEWLALRRNPRDLIGLAQPLGLAFLVLALFMSGGKGVEPLRSLFFWFMLMFLGLFLSALPVGTPLLSIAQEGRRIALLRSAPISMSDVLKCKFWATWVPMVLSWTLVFLVADTWLQFPLWQVGFLVGMTIWGLAGGSLECVMHFGPRKR